MIWMGVYYLNIPPLQTWSSEILIGYNAIEGIQGGGGAALNLIQLHGGFLASATYLEKILGSIWIVIWEIDNSLVTESPSYHYRQLIWKF